VPLFNILAEDERRHLANTCREISLGPLERIIIQGRHGTSLFVVGEGRLEVFVRQLDGVDKLVDVKKRGDVIGEVSLLTDAPRTATVRAADGAVVYEIGLKQYETIVKARPAVVDELATIMEEHLRTSHEVSEAYNIEKETAQIRQRIKRFFFGI
jgi:CRP-like cAMP-binding protein